MTPFPHSVRTHPPGYPETSMPVTTDVDMMHPCQHLCPHGHTTIFGQTFEHFLLYLSNTSMCTIKCSSCDRSLLPATQRLSSPVSSCRDGRHRPRPHSLPTSLTIQLLSCLRRTSTTPTATTPPTPAIGTHYPLTASCPSSLAATVTHVSAAEGSEKGIPWSALPWFCKPHHAPP